MRLVVQDLATQPIQQLDLEVQVLEVQDLPNQHLHLIVVLVLAGLEPRVTQQLQHLDSLDLDHQDFCRQIPATAAVCHLDKWEDTNKPSPFGTTASQPSAFGSTATQPSNNKPSPFGQTNTSNSPLVSNTAATTAPTNTSSPFGSSNNNTSNPFGGQSSTSSPFGQTQTSSSTFGASNQTQSAFGTASTQNTNLGFGSNNSASTIANTNQNSSTTNNANPFGSTSEATPTFSFISTQPKSQPQTQTTRSIDVDIQENTQNDSLPALILEAFNANMFTLGKIPDVPPPPELCR